MRWHILAIGKPKLPFARSGIEEYASRLTPMGVPVEFSWLKAGTREAESTALLQRSEGLLRVLLDEKGEQVGSRDLATRISRWEQSRAKGIALLIGGADGHTDALRQRADWQWSLSMLTLQHELALLVAMEQLYRAYMIKAGTPYHRD